MQTAPLLQIVTIVADLMIFVFVGFYLWTLRKDRKILDDRQKVLSQKEAKIESEFRQIIENAHAKERKILEEASNQAKNITANTQAVSSSTKDLVNKALQQMAQDMQKEASTSSSNYLENHKNFLAQISDKSSTEFQNVVKRFEAELEAQMREFRSTTLANIQKELEEYKNKRIKDADVKVNDAIKIVSQKVFNKAISKEDHKNLILEALDKAQKEGVFD